MPNRHYSFNMLSFNALQRKATEYPRDEALPNRHSRPPDSIRFIAILAAATEGCHFRPTADGIETLSPRRSPCHVKISRTTVPDTSVRRNGRPL